MAEGASKKECPACGVTFKAEGRQKQRRFCSDACRIRYYNGQRNPEGPSEKECPACGIMFKASGRGQQRVYCSDACRIKHGRKQRTEQRRSMACAEEKACPQCGKVFQTTQRGVKQKRFCSAECKANYWTDQRCPGRHDEKICRACGAQFKREYRKQYYCSACRAAREQKRKSLYEEKSCPQCGKAFLPERSTAGKPRRFCSRECNVAWWSKHRKALDRKVLRSRECPVCGKEFHFYNGNSRKYCSQACAVVGYREHVDARARHEDREGRKAVVREAARLEAQRRRAESTEDVVDIGLSAEKREFLRLRRQGLTYQSIAECMGKSMNTVKSWGMRYIGPSYHIAMPTAQVQSAEEWRALLRLTAAENTSPKPPQRILLVCGISHVSHGLENMLAVIRYRLHVDPLGGDLFVFCGTGHKTLVTLEWDGGGLRVAKRRSQRGTYPWPPRRLGPLMEISEEEYLLLLSYSPKKILTGNH